MKKFFAAALISALAGGQASADNASPMTPVNNSAITAPSGHRIAIIKDESDADHDMSNHHGYGMMEGNGVDTMMESDMRMLESLALSKEQKSKINNLSDEFNHNIWAIQGLINDEAAKLRFLYEADRRDPVAIGKEYIKVFDFKRQMIETYLDTQNRIEDILTPEQRAKLKDSRHEMHHIYGHPLK